MTPLQKQIATWAAGIGVAFISPLTPVLASGSWPSPSDWPKAVAAGLAGAFATYLRAPKDHTTEG